MPFNQSTKRISRNVTATVLQVIVSGIVFFILYRFLYDRLGVEQIGVWSLVLAATSVSRIGELGLSAGVVRFVAQAMGRGDTQRAAEVIQTVSLTLALVMAVLLFACSPLFILALNYFIPAQSVSIALSILPYALFSLWTMVLISVFSGGLDGCLRMDLRCLLIGLSHLVYLGLVVALVPQYGLKGVAIAQLLQSAGLMIILWCVLRRQLSPLPFIPLQWKLLLLKEMIRYGVSFQIISIMNMLFDPMVKALMSRFGGLEALGYYVMANKLILQGRAIIVEASRVMVPAVATLQEHDNAKTTHLFITSYQMTFFISVLFYGLLGIFITTISILWIGHYQSLFIHFLLLLNLGWFVNTLICPAYFYNLGSGKLRANMISHIIISLCSLFVGSYLGYHFGGEGVAIGVVVGLITGSLFLLVSHIKQANLHWPTFIIPKNMSILLIFSILATFLSNFAKDQQSSIIAVTGIALLFSFLLLSLGWFNSVKIISLRGGKQ